MKSGIKHLSAVFSFLYITTYALSAIEIPYQSDTDFTELSQISEPLGTDQLIEMFLISSGTDSESIPVYTQILQKHIQSLKDFVQTNRVELEDSGEIVLKYMHENILSRYDYHQTRLNTLLDNGNYNCVSSAVLYMLLTRSLGMEVYGIHSSDHAFCSIQPSDGSDAIDVETTNLWGYDPGQKKEFHSDFTDKTGYIYVPPGDYSDRTQLGDRDMAGLILQNRIVENQKRNNYEKALELAADRLVLTQSEQAVKDYFDSVQNQAAWYNRLHEYEKGIDVIQTVSKGPYDLPDFLIQTRYQMVYNFCGTILNSGDTEKAESVMIRYKHFLPDTLIEELTFLIEEKKLDHIIKQGYSEDTLIQVYKALNRGIITKKRAGEMLVYLYASEAEKIALTSNYLEALLFLKESESWVQETRDFIRLLSAYKQNYAVSIHNAVIPMINSAQYEDAVVLLEKGLEIIPDNQLLISDLKKIESTQ